MGDKRNSCRRVHRRRTGIHKNVVSQAGSGAAGRARAVRRARRRRGRDGRLAHLRAARRCRPVHQRLLAGDAGAAAALRLDAARRRAGGAPSQRFSRAAILAGLAFAGDLFFWHLSIVHTSVANATFFATTAPIWVVLFGWLLFRQRAAPGVLAGLCLCLIGGAALMAESLQLKPAGALGDAFGIATGVFFGLYFLAVQAARKKASAARLTFEATLITAAIPFAVALVAERSMLPHSAGGLAALLALAWISHTGGQGLLSVALGRLPAAFSSLVIFLEAIAAAGFGWLVLNEPVSAIQALGGLVILAGIFVARPKLRAIGIYPAIVAPPSTTMVWPVMNEPAFEAR